MHHTLPALSAPQLGLGEEGVMLTLGLFAWRLGMRTAALLPSAPASGKPARAAHPPRPPRKAAPRLADSVPGRVLAARAHLGERVGAGSAAGRCFCSERRWGGGCAEPRVQMGGSGEGAWGAVSRSNADGVSRTQFRWQTILMKRRANLPQPASFSGAFRHLPRPTARVSTGTIPTSPP